jgi:hypothetical protein
MTTTLKQFQGSLVDPKDDAKVYQFLGGVSGVVAGCVVTLYATNQLKVSDGWGFACGRVFTIEEEIVVANTAAAKGRIIVNIDLENVAEPAALTTQSAAVLPALVQEDINADGTVFQLALAQYDIASNTISNLTDVRVMLYDVDSRLSAKQDKISNVANRLFYGSGTAGSLSQLTSPSTSGSVLRQNTSGAPYWTTPADLVTALKSSLINMLYPVGSIYLSVNSTSPATLFGGTWAQLKDRFLLGAGNVYANGNTGGEASHALTEGETPWWRTVNEASGYSLGNAGGFANRVAISRGSADAHNNMPPYLVVYMWKRTA